MLVLVGLGVQIENGLFVVKSAADICVTNFNDNEFPINEFTSKHTFITFAINGLSVETVLEFITHIISFIA